ncbi:MAG TPA: bifunctional precorrin-2 dehydrogenase/sirohydrochlorin ferrochelatase [Deltaproteobacteria bacterium]|nr:bifunctional precorrin-2 dehydrogenase/sirohydrochlorin ferrochelatase [Deltaproteobacteria bacterium]
MDVPTNPYVPMFVDLRGRRAVVVGGGAVAARKVESLAKSGARVLVVAPDVCREIAEIEGVTIERRPYREQDLDGALVVIAATSDPRVNREVSEHASSRGILCNVVDTPELCSFIVPSVVERGPIKVAISTGGLSPALSRRLRRIVGTAIGDEYVTLAMVLGRIRPVVRSMSASSDDHRRVFEILIDSELLDAIRRSDRSRAEGILREALGVDVDLEGILV